MPPVIVAVDGPSGSGKSSVSKGVAQRLGFMIGELSVPDDFDRMGGDEIENLFTGHTA